MDNTAVSPFADAAVPILTNAPELDDTDRANLHDIFQILNLQSNALLFFNGAPLCLSPADYVQRIITYSLIRFAFAVGAVSLNP